MSLSNFNFDESDVKRTCIATDYFQSPDCANKKRKRSEKCEVVNKKPNQGFKQCVVTPAGDTVIWGKCKGHGWWPGRIAKDSELDGDPEKPGDPTRWVQWYGDFKYSETKIWEMEYLHNFQVYFRPQFYASNQLYRKAIHQALTYMAKKINKNINLECSEELMAWSINMSAEEKDALTPPPFDIRTPASDFDVKVNDVKQEAGESSEDCSREAYGEERLKAVKKIQSGKKTLEDICVGCGSESIKIQHPLFVGGYCEDCDRDFRDFIYLLDEQNGGSYCCICGEGIKVLLCDETNCCKSFCTFCIALLAGKEALSKEVEVDPWVCFLCRSVESVGLIQRRPDWKDRLCTYISTEENSQHFDVVDIPKQVIPKTRTALRVLSLFDGIASGLVALKEIGLKVEVYFSSEINIEANLVSKNHHPELCHLGDVREITDSMLSKMGPIDLVIGGSPCNDLSIVNPARKGIWGGTGQLFFEFVRILNTCKLLACSEGRNLFWLFENVVCMDRASRAVMDRYLQRKGVVLDAKHVSPARRPRYFWGNLPGMKRPLLPTSSHRLDLNDCLQPGRVSAAKKIRTITTKTNSVPRDLVKFQQRSNFDEWFTVELLKDIPNSGPDKLWITEIERIFGFPDHYTDVADLSSTHRLKIIGRSWSVPVIKHLFAPLKDFFLSTNENSTKKEI